MFRKFVCALVVPCLVVSVAGCGGGGGGGGAPATASYEIGGTVSGLWLGNSVGLRDNGVDNLTVQSNGTFVFPKKVSDSGGFSVTVATQPAPGQTCVVSNETGKVSGANVTGVSVSCTVSAAYRDNSGKEFILGFLPDASGAGAELLLTGDKATTGTASISGLAFSQSFSVAPGDVTRVPLPAAAADPGAGRAVRVTSADPIVVVAANTETDSADSYLALPTDVTGRAYQVLSYDALIPGPGTEFPSEVLVAATQDGTSVTVVTTATTSLGGPGTYDLSLDRLDTYLLQTVGAGDLSGTQVTATKPVAVVSGGMCANVPAGTPFCDHLVEQLMPRSAWDTTYYVESLATRSGGDILRVTAQEDGTALAGPTGIGGVTLAAGATVEASFASGASSVITASKPVMVMQYAKGSTADGVADSDPFMMTVQGASHFLTAYTLATADTASTSYSSYANLIIPDADIPDCLLDGAVLPALTFAAIGASGFSGARMPVAGGAHTIECPHAFGASVYGFANGKSYGHPAGLFVPAPAAASTVTPAEVANGLAQAFNALGGTEITSAPAGGTLTAGVDYSYAVLGYAFCLPSDLFMAPLASLPAGQTVYGCANDVQAVAAVSANTLTITLTAAALYIDFDASVTVLASTTPVAGALTASDPTFTIVYNLEPQPDGNYKLGTLASADFTTTGWDAETKPALLAAYLNLLAPIVSGLANDQVAALALDQATAYIPSVIEIAP